MPGGPLRQIRPAWIATSAYCPFVPGLSLGPRKSTEFLVTKVQSTSRMIGVNSQSLYPASPSQTIWLVSPWSLSIAIFASSGLRHSSIRNFIPHSYGAERGGRGRGSRDRKRVWRGRRGEEGV